MYNRIRLFDQSFNNVNTNGALGIIDEYIDSKSNKIICGKNVFLVVECTRNKNMYRFYESVDLVTVDGRPLVYISRLLLKKPFSEMVGGPKLWSAMVGHIYRKKYSLFILGGTELVVKTAVSKLKHKYPDLNICGYRNGYFNNREIKQIVNECKHRGPDIIFLGLPSPLKEKIALKLKSGNISSLVVLVGGMIDIFAEDKKLSPLWMSFLCLEWLYRLWQEPKRLWKRYLISNFKFFMLLIKELLKKSCALHGGI